ncbi:uncharacterized protein LOC124938560 [Impatiens glandulifera]|uniref:uncharacterized protein LOC124938560 n=1 Tax=Impatiens glandulifera TaxID=253017 RepID=UPI001FB0E8E4|nr:uncharacterized protein LOC124938560 [Impatiens glandulifera]
MANPSGAYQHTAHSIHGSTSSLSGSSSSIACYAAVKGTSPPVQENLGFEPAPSLRNNSSWSTEWTTDEQSILEEGLNEYASLSNIIKYAKIALLLPDKTVRDVAFRCKWMAKVENFKRRKEEPSLTKKSKDKMVKSTITAARSPFPTYVQPPVMTRDSNEGGVPYEAVGGSIGQLLEQNVRAFGEINGNLAAYKIHENIGIFYQARENILKMLQELRESGDAMNQMPPLPVTLDEGLINSLIYT